MTDGEALLAAILANPDEDTPRLVYADWLQEIGQDLRAELIRVQIELARRYPNWEGIPSPDSLAVGGDYHRLRVREAALLGSTAAFGWRLLPWGLSAPGQWRRGFIEHVTCTAKGWFTHAGVILAAHPVRKVTLIGAVDVYFEPEDETFRIRGQTSTWVVIRADSPDLYGRLETLSLSPKTATSEQALGAMWPGITFEFPAAP